MKKLAGIVMLVSGCMPLLFIIVFKIKQQYIHHEMEEQLETRILRSITVAKKNVHWIEKGKEILFEGRMFDIKTCKQQGEHYIFTGLFDDDETALMQQLEEKQNNSSSPDTKNIARLFQWLQSVYKDPQEKNTLTASSINRKILFDHIIQLPSRFIPILTPPPQI